MGFIKFLLENPYLMILTIIQIFCALVVFFSDRGPQIAVIVHDREDPDEDDEDDSDGEDGSDDDEDDSDGEDGSDDDEDDSDGEDGSDDDEVEPIHCPYGGWDFE